MERVTTIHLLCTLARDFYTVQIKSIVKLLQESVYFDLDQDILEDELAREFSLDSASIEAWFQYSEGKRSDSGWYIVEEKNSFYVGYFGHPGRQGISFRNREAACARFAKMEIEDIASRLADR